MSVNSQMLVGIGSWANNSERGTTPVYDLLDFNLPTVNQNYECHKTLSEHVQAEERLEKLSMLDRFLGERERAALVL